MFTGIVEEVGKIKKFDGYKLVIECYKILSDIKTGDSIAVDGCCQTVISFDKNTFTTNVSNETLNITAGFKIGNYVNLESALTPSSKMGGHIVQGHIDGVAKYLGNSTFELSDKLAKFVVYKGSITVNGISLTVASIDKNTFIVAIVPHTFENTTFKYLKSGDFVNIETDILGKYVEKFLSLQNNNITTDFLKENGFV